MQKRHCSYDISIATDSQATTNLKDYREADALLGHVFLLQSL
ncbi:hypothetical protein SLEP1_g56634 [Rubroshorea leprosula]|uniref:Uncharacterized protein n=1 Tax=Rubroshorea leprosula TaxID=152421 RepID=A0AAV5MIW9_9ROSI|nr:hypothetical protein SLEP1_g56634 [Rubroshorea leprosula]